MKELSILFLKEYFHFYGLAGSLTGLMGGYCELIYTSTDYAEKDCIFQTTQDHFLWSWRESNPRPNKEPKCFLHAYLYIDFCD